MKFFLILLVALSISCAIKDDYCERDEHGSCKVNTNTCEEEDEPCFLDEPVQEKESVKSGYPHFETLSRLDGMKVGSEQHFNIDGFNFKLLTRSLKPLLFEIPNALSEDEMAHVLEKAMDPHYSGGLFASQAKGGLTPEDSFKPSTAKGKALGPAGQFSNWDLNEDKIIDLDEVGKFCRNYNFLYFTETEVKQMLKDLDIHEFDDGFVDENKFEMLNTLGIEDHLNRMMREHPKFKQRFSDQVWLPMAEEYDPVLSSIRERFGKLFHIPYKILLGSEHLQVVRYQPFGHYHAHHDSETEKAVNKPCCHHTNSKTIQQYAKCRLCRFMTIMIYLREPEDGGETAFPAADNITYSDASFRRRGNPGVDLFNLSEHCYDSNLVVKARKGTAVAWYNHLVDYKGWLGALDEWSLHGGCEVRKGEKWIMNLWLTAPYKDDVDTPSMYSLESILKEQASINA
ncbi:transmembrane prolyl 4-hydroxylase-like [Hydractinia symbiolongicarpus]|uniref:transmembrane prolyl 4-hydroxylase-like n=1 Tax=Hydractinia symbiolongicarpus TaxID=13093 RepID=UPI00254B478C|nr:transmembrane prolyl 4-hydroxylase-like [Hydractinia symbiolongicarpus]XP_057291011.1 transmembrane prolyl 4-hydroxylase-like [Hydractinia symbiolongicarpus]